MKPVDGTILTVSRGANIGAKKSRIYQRCSRVMRAALEGAKNCSCEDSRYVASLERSWRGRLWWSAISSLEDSFVSLTGGAYCFKSSKQHLQPCSEMINAEHHKSVAGHVATGSTSSLVTVQKSWSLWKQGPTYVKDFDYDDLQLFEQPWDSYW